MPRYKIDETLRYNSGSDMYRTEDDRMGLCASQVTRITGTKRHGCVRVQVSKSKAKPAGKSWRKIAFRASEESDSDIVEVRGYRLNSIVVNKAARLVAEKSLVGTNAWFRIIPLEAP